MPTNTYFVKFRSWAILCFSPFSRSALNWQHFQQPVLYEPVSKHTDCKTVPSSAIRRSKSVVDASRRGRSIQQPCVRRCCIKKECEKLGERPSRPHLPSYPLHLDVMLKILATEIFSDILHFFLGRKRFMVTNVVMRELYVRSALWNRQMPMPGARLSGNLEAAAETC
jgi:hypothetical protein